MTFEAAVLPATRAEPTGWGPDGLGTSATRKARLQISPSPGPHNALWYFPQVTGGHLRVARNAALIQLARYTPSLPLKQAIYRMLGMQVGRHAAVGLMVMFDIFFPQDVTLGENCIVGYNSTVLCHEFLRHEWRRGPVVIEQDVTIGANCTILPGVVIGAGATVSAMSLVNRDVPPGALVGGVPVRMIRPGN
ncbi:MAG: acyltransferase [Chloroflexaceae bacterium]|jgi:acetyltransferase-like isoleucine patch superfamily enzyme|nr:acyltransferase [Chloroflexaceae bacterium]